MLRKIVLKLGLGWVGREFRAVAEGKRGPAARRLYVALQGNKTALGLLAGAVVAALSALGYVSAAEQVVGVIGSLGLVGLGLLDKAWRSDIPPSVTMSPVYVLARDHVADLAALVALASAQLATCSPDTAAMLARLHLTCGSASAALAVIVGLAGWLGLEVGASQPPARR